MTVKHFFQMSLWLTLIAPQCIDAQQVIKLENPSFEDFPQPAQVPTGWIDCGFQTETPPDVHPNGVFQVSKPAKHGKTYLGMVVRDNETWESIGQKLEMPLQKDICYKFSLQMCRSACYVSKSKLTNKDVNYITPVVVRIWGGTQSCQKTEKLAESELVENMDWELFTFKLQPKADYYYLMIEVFYKTPTLFPYNGNVLIDNASDLVPINAADSIPAHISLPQKKQKFPCGNGDETRSIMLQPPPSLLTPPIFLPSENVTIIKVKTQNVYLYLFKNAMSYANYEPQNKQDVKSKASSSNVLQTLDWDRLATLFKNGSSTASKTHQCESDVSQNALVFYNEHDKILNYLEWCFGCGYAKCFGEKSISIDNQLFKLKENPSRKELSHFFEKVYELLK
jgi:hypothetical protein